MKGFGGLIALVSLLLLANIGASATVLVVSVKQDERMKRIQYKQSQIEDALKAQGFYTEGR